MLFRSATVPITGNPSATGQLQSAVPELTGNPAVVLDLDLTVPVTGNPSATGQLQSAVPELTGNPAPASQLAATAPVTGDLPAPQQLQSAVPELTGNPAPASQLAATGSVAAALALTLGVPLVSNLAAALKISPVSSPTKSFAAALKNYSVMQMNLYYKPGDESSEEDDNCINLLDSDEEEVFQPEVRSPQQHYTQHVMWITHSMLIGRR